MNKMVKKKETKAKIGKVAPEYEESYFVSAENPVELRRHLLESTKKTVLSMQNYERLQMIREKKLQELSNLRQSIKELVYLNKKFNDKLPKYDTELLHEFKHVGQESKAVAKAASVALKKGTMPSEQRLARDKTDMEKLEESLAAIEKKLQTLNK